MLPLSHKFKLEENKHNQKMQLEHLKAGAEQRRKDEEHEEKMRGYAHGTAHVLSGNQQKLAQSDAMHQQKMKQLDDKHKQGMKHKDHGQDAKMSMSVAKHNRAMGFETGTLSVPPLPSSVFNPGNSGYASGVASLPGPAMPSRVPMPNGGFNYGGPDTPYDDVHHYALGSHMVPGYKGGRMPVPTNPEAGPSDTVPAMLTPGEAVIPREAAQDPRLKPVVKQLINHGRQVQRMNQGGTVPPMAYSQGTWGVPGYFEGTDEIGQAIMSVAEPSAADISVEEENKKKLLAQTSPKVAPPPEPVAITDSVPAALPISPIQGNVRNNLGTTAAQANDARASFAVNDPRRGAPPRPAGDIAPRTAVVGTNGAAFGVRPSVGVKAADSNPNAIDLSNVSLERLAGQDSVGAEAAANKARATFAATDPRRTDVVPAAAPAGPVVDTTNEARQVESNPEGNRPLTDRLNNAGAMIYYKGAENLPGYDGTYKTEDGREFIKFKTPDAGLDAAVAQINKYQNGGSPAYKAKHGDKPLTPETLIETWAPTGKENSVASTTNYKAFIAKKLGIGVNDPIPNTPEARKIVAQSIKEFERGGGGTVGKANAAPTVPPVNGPAAPPPAPPAAASEIKPDGSLDGGPTVTKIPPPQWGSLDDGEAATPVSAAARIDAVNKTAEMLKTPKENTEFGWAGEAKGILQTLAKTMGFKEDEVNRMALIFGANKMMGLSNKKALQHSFKTVEAQASKRATQEATDNRADKRQAASDKKTHDTEILKEQLRLQDQKLARDKEDRLRADTRGKEDRDADRKSADELAKQAREDGMSAQDARDVADREYAWRQHNRKVEAAIPTVRQHALTQAKKDNPNATDEQLTAHAEKITEEWYKQQTGVVQRPAIAARKSYEAVDNLVGEHQTNSVFNRTFHGRKSKAGGVEYQIPVRGDDDKYTLQWKPEEEAKRILNQNGVSLAKETIPTVADQRKAEKEDSAEIAGAIKTAKENAKEANGGKMPQHIAYINEKLAATSAYTILQNLGMNPKDTRQAVALAQSAGQLMIREAERNGKKGDQYEDIGPFMKQVMFNKMAGVGENDPLFLTEDKKPMKAEHIAKLQDELVRAAKDKFILEHSRKPNAVELDEAMKGMVNTARETYKKSPGKYASATNKDSSGFYLMMLDELKKIK